jgi:hypothetical protein
VQDSVTSGARRREANKRAVFGGTIVQLALDEHSPASGACLEWASVHRFFRPRKKLHTAKNKLKNGDSRNARAKSDARLSLGKNRQTSDSRESSGSQSSDDPRLAAIVEAWPTLPEAIREKMAAITNASSTAASGERGDIGPTDG